LSLAPGRRLRTRLAGAFLFLPLLARLRLDQLAGRAGYPGSAMAVHFHRRSHNPLLRAAALDRETPAIPWLQGRKITFRYT